MDLISSIIGIIYCTLFEFFHGKSLLHSRIYKKNHKIYWYLLIIFRKNFKKFILKLGLDPWKYPTNNDLIKIRTTGKNDLKKFFSDESTSFLLRFLSIRLQSSGSSGTPFEFRIFILQWIEEQARVYSSFRLAGYRIGKKMVVFRSYSPKNNEKNIKKIWWKRWTYFNSFALDDKNLKKYYNYLKSENIKFLRTYPSTLSTFLKFLKENDLKLNLKMIHCSSENIDEKLISESENYFGCKVINYYGQVEQAILGINLINKSYINLLPYTSYYISSEDNSLITLNLLNWTNPLVNYKVDDKVEQIKNNNFRIIGRSNLFLKHINGFEVSTVNFYTLMQRFDSLVKWQIFQSKNYDISINYEGDLVRDDTNTIDYEIKKRLGNLKISFNKNSFNYDGEGKINPIAIEKE